MEKRPEPGTGRPTAEGTAQDRTIRALVSLADDLSVEGGEEGFLRSSLEHLVECLGLAGGATFVLESDGSLKAAAEWHLPGADRDAAMELARSMAGDEQPRVSARPAGGWIAAAPLCTKRRRLGVLTLHDPTGRTPAPATELLEAVGKQIGTGLENARRYAELRVSSARAEVLHRIAGSLTSGSDLKTVIPAFARQIAAFEPFDRLACGFLNDSGDYIEIAGYPDGAAWGLGSLLPVVGSGPGTVVLDDRPIIQRDLLHNHRFVEDMRLLEEGIRSYVVMPLNSRGRSIGVLALGSKADGAYDESTLSRMEPLADSVALALENVRLFQKTRELSITDEVTPLYNHRFINQIIDRELKLVDRYRSVLTLIFIDLDRFKPINDRYGHLRGSRMLREVGFLLRSAVRETDYPARYGGDEFVVILPQTDAAAAAILGEKLRKLIEEHTFLQEEGINARVGMSLGVASYPGEAPSKEALIRLADERMYQDKERRKQP
jgi:diguanylate cyclase (GGDEF)-like protein